ncbi:DNA polymerase delta subunit 4 [Discoglossus pictus]
MGRKRPLTQCYPVVKKGESSAKRKTERSTAKDTELRRDKQDDAQQSPALSPSDTLIHFDLDWHFGPCVGITRLERWQRAQRLGLSPPKVIGEMLMANSKDPAYQNCLWHEYPL